MKRLGFNFAVLILLIQSCCADEKIQSTLSSNAEIIIGTPSPLLSPPTLNDNHSINVTEKYSGFFQETTNIGDETISKSETEVKTETTLLPHSHKKWTADDLYDPSEDEDYIEIRLPTQRDREQSKQIGFPSNPLGLVTSRLPCSCQSGYCGCCTGMLLQTFRTKGCMNITYVPEDFAFEFKMMMNNAVLYKNRLSGRNPEPVCVRPPRFRFIQVCVTFSDIYFVGRNMHVCMDLDANFEGFELFSRSFDCLRVGDQGVKIVKPGEGSGLPDKPSVAAEVDAGEEDIEEYDENVVRRFDRLN